MPIKKLFIDTETTGADPKRHGLIEVAFIVEYSGVYEEYMFNCRLFEGDEIDPSAEKQHGHTKEDIGGFPDPKEVYIDIVTVLGKHIDRYDKQDKFFFIGYGAEFDNNFLRAFFDKNNDKYFGSWFFTPYIDVMPLAAYALMEDRYRMENFKLSTVARFVDIEVEDKKLHGALYDAWLARELYNKVTKGILTAKSSEETFQDRIKLRKRTSRGTRGRSTSSMRGRNDDRGD